MKPSQARRPGSAVASPPPEANAAPSPSRSVATATSPSTTESPTSSPKRTGPEKSASVSGLKRQRHHGRKLNKVQLAASSGSALSSSPGSGPSLSSSHGGPTSVSSVATPQETSLTIAAKEAKTASQQNAPHCVFEYKGATAAVLPRKPDGAGAEPSTKTSAVAASTTPAKKAGSSTHEHASRVADIYEALTALAPSLKKPPARQGSLKSFTMLTTFLARGGPSRDDDTPTRAAAVRKSRRLFGAAAVMGTLLVVIILATTSFVYEKSKRQRQETCATSGCVEYLNRIEDQLEKGVDPCDDFSAYVCSRWKSKEMFTLSRSEFSTMFLNWLYRLPVTLKKGISRFPVGKKVAAMYDSCMSQTRSRIHTMKKFMRERGIFWPEKPKQPIPPVKVLFDLSINWNVHLWFTVKILPEIPNKMPRRIFLEPNDLLIFWKEIINSIPEAKFHRVYEELYKIFSDNASAVPDAKSTSEMYQMLEYVFNTFVPSCPCKTRVPGLFRLSDIDHHAPFPVSHHMMTILNAVGAVHPPVTMDDLVLVNGLSQLAQTWTIIKKAGYKALWLFLLGFAAVANPTAILLVFHGSEHRANEELPRFCAGQVEPSYKLLIAAMASVVYFSEDERHRIEDQLDGIVQIAVEKIEATSWLDNVTKRVAIEKLKSVRTVLWPSKKFLTPKVLDEVYKDFPRRSPSFTDFWIETRRSQRFLLGSEVVEEELLLGDNHHLPYVEYAQVLNRISISIGALAPPLYYPDGTEAMLHGGILYLYARALVKAIGNDEATVNLQGEVMPTWLSDEVKDAFEQRTLSCRAANMSSFPDVPGMEVAYEALKRQLGKRHVQLSKTLTEEKVFFITTCLATCSLTPADNLFAGDCNKAVMNFAPFAKAFECPLGSPMNPVNKCPFFD